MTRALRHEFKHATIINEVATILLDGGFPKPERWTNKWQSNFQQAIFQCQIGFEEAATHAESNLTICDRGLMDGAAYHLGGVRQFCRDHGINTKWALDRYDLVIHLESTAICAPEAYGSHSNKHRRESLEEAVQLDHKTREAWEGHPNRKLITGRIEEKIAETIQLIRGL